MDAQMKKGVLEMCILFIISKREMYGYDVTKTMKQYFPEVNDSTFYSFLRRLNTEGITETYLSDISGGPTRKYYKITEAGLSYLKNSIEDWKKISEIVECIGIQ